MKFLIDNNLSFKLTPSLLRDFSGTAHVRDTTGTRADDKQVWDFALTNGFVILTKDNDFDERSQVEGCPPKIVHLLCGNKPTEYILELIQSNVKEIISFGEADLQNCILKIY